MKRITPLLVLIIVYVIAIACKDALPGPTYPITDFSEYNCVVVATVNKAVHDDQGYRALKTFSVTIKRSLKGDLEIGKQMSGEAKREEARAVCPVHLDENSDYLLLLTKSAGGYKLSRFSFPVKKGYLYFDDYITQIEKRLSAK